jgi:hypothetical protein
MFMKFELPKFNKNILFENIQKLQQRTYSPQYLYFTPNNAFYTNFSNQKTVQVHLSNP